MSTYEDKKKMAEQFPPGTNVLVEIESIKDPKESPFKAVFLLLIINILKII
jgi:hypothetical protein